MRHLAFRAVVSTLCLIVFPQLASATTRRVRQDGTGDFTTIGAAVAAAVASDVIEVGPGIYPEQVDVYVTLSFVSTNGAAGTIMDGEGSHYTLWFRDGAGHMVDGFTFRNGYNFSGGGAIRCMNAATLTLKNSVLDSNTSGHDGGGIFTRDTGSFIDAYDCLFTGNYATHNGSAGIAILDSRINYTRCRFINNTNDFQNAGVSCDHSRMDVRECLFVGNSSPSFSCIYYYIASGNVEQNTFYKNHSGEYSSVLVHYSNVNVRRNILTYDTAGHGLIYLGGDGAHECNVYYQNAMGPIDGGLDPTELVINPQFCDPANMDFTLPWSSPAAPPNNPCGVLIGAFPVTCSTVAVAISSFEATAENGFVHLHGKFRSDLAVESVAVYRSEGEAQLVRLATVPMAGGEEFEYADRTVAPGKTYRYRIGVTDGDGEFMSQIQSVQVAALKNVLDQNRPNPFNPTTTVHYTIAASSLVKLDVYDAAGHLVRSLVKENQPAGTHQVTWDGRDDRGTTAASGVYFCRLEAGKYRQTIRMVMLK